MVSKMFPATTIRRERDNRHVNRPTSHRVKCHPPTGKMPPHRGRHLVFCGLLLGQRRQRRISKQVCDCLCARAISSHSHPDRPWLGAQTTRRFCRRYFPERHRDFFSVREREWHSRDLKLFFSSRTPFIVIDHDIYRDFRADIRVRVFVENRSHRWKNSGVVRCSHSIRLLV